MARRDCTLHCRPRQRPGTEGADHLSLLAQSRRFQLLAPRLGGRRSRGQDAAGAGFLQALYRADAAGRRGRRRRGDTDRMDRRNHGLNYFIKPAAVSARVMTALTAMLRFGACDGLASRGFVSRGLTWCTGVARGHSVATRSGDCRDAVAADGMVGVLTGLAASLGWLTRSVR